MSRSEAAPNAPLPPTRSDPRPYRVEVGDSGDLRVDGVSAEQTVRLFVDGEAIGGTLGTLLPAPCADLVDVAMAVYASDRLCPRRATTGGAGVAPPRSIHLTLPLREPARWEGQLNLSLCEALGHLTSDTWAISFRSKTPLGQQGQLFARHPQGPVDVALFSGGLDSLAGAVRTLESDASRGVILVGASSSTRMQQRQSSLLDALTERYRERLLPLVVRFGIRRPGSGRHRDEPTQRARNFAYTALGAAAAISAGYSSLDVFENGIGALNLPYSRVQRGAAQTRGSHPRSLKALGELFSLATGSSFRLRLPNLFVTKAEMCEALRADWARVLVAKTVSCDSFPLRSSEASQCGTCTSCLLRRQALANAGLRWDDATGDYLHDIFDPDDDVPASTEPHLGAVLAQVADMEADLAGSDPLGRLVRRYPGLAEAVASHGADMTPAAVRDAYVALIRRHCAEWRAISGRIPATSRRARAQLRP